MATMSDLKLASRAIGPGWESALFLVSFVLFQGEGLKWANPRHPVSALQPKEPFTVIQ